MFKTVALFLFSLAIFLIHRQSHPNLTSYLPLRIYSSSPVVETVFFLRKTFITVKKDVDLLQNSDFPYKFSPLNQSDTEKQKNLHLLCSPISFGYNQKASKKIFPDFHYPPCSEVTGKNESTVYIDRKTNKIQFTCNKKHKRMIKGPLANLTLMNESFVEDAKLVMVDPSTLNAAETEYVFGFCNKKKFKHRIRLQQRYAGSHMTPLYKPELNITLKKKGKIIFMLTLDSFSRNHFYRKLPNVVELLNKSEELFPDYSVFDFKLHSTYSRDTITNQSPIFGGKDYMKKQNHSNHDKLGNNALWFQLKEKKFITFIGLDDCDKGFTRELGQNIKIDYSVRQFYCITEMYFRILNSKKNLEQRCLGPHQIHFYLLNYTLDLLRLYPTSNIFIYLHLNAAHEKTGQHAVTLNNDLTNFLQDFFKVTKNSEVFMFLGADHGMRYGAWYHSVEAYQETKLPAMFVIASKSWLDRYPKSYHSLSENSWRLTSKLDIRKTILSLADIEDEESKSINLLQEIASTSRLCMDINVKPAYCACSNTEKLKNFNSELKSLFKSIAFHVENLINTKAYTFHRLPPGLYCKKVELKIIKNAFHIDINNLLEIFIIEFGIHSSKARFKVTVLVGTEFSTVKEEESQYKWFEIKPNMFRMMAKVIDIERTDKYGGPFQNFLEKVGIDPEFCIPNDYLLIKYF